MLDDPTIHDGQTDRQTDRQTIHLKQSILIIQSRTIQLSERSAVNRQAHLILEFVNRLLSRLRQLIIDNGKGRTTGSLLVQQFEAFYLLCRLRHHSRSSTEIFRLR
jgi:hypothetical protein